MTSMFALWAGAVLALGGPVTEVAITSVAGQTSVLIVVDGTVEHRAFMMDGPYRLVVDLMGAENALPREDFSGVDRGGIVRVRASQYSRDIVRVVLELTDRLGYSVLPDPRGLRITLENPEVTGFEPWSSGTTAMSAFDPTTLAPAPQQQLSQAERISITFIQTPIMQVLLAFATFSGNSIVPGSNIAGEFVTAEIIDTPWDVALETILLANGLVGEEDDYGIIRVDNIEDLNARELVEPILTAAYPVSYAPASELETAVTPLLSERGSITSGQGTNTLIVSDIARVQEQVEVLLRQLDVEPAQVSISAKIIFVNRTELRELGVTYELKDSQGNQINNLSSGLADLDGDGVLDVVEQGTAIISLGGNSVAALGNAAARVGNPTLQLLTSLVVGRHQLISFLDVLQSVNLSDIEAEPQVTTLDNHAAELIVGELTPIRIISAGAGATGEGTFPTAQVDQQQTGIILQATPHVTESGLILLELVVERSSAELAESDAGFIFRNQRGQTRMLVADGETVVIAGLTQRERSEARSGIPLLMDLPVIGRFFRSTREQEIQRDLIILVTPHIVRRIN